jgi:hypothetical protein
LTSLFSRLIGPACSGLVCLFVFVKIRNNKHYWLYVALFLPPPFYLFGCLRVIPFLFHTIILSPFFFVFSLACFADSLIAWEFIKKLMYLKWNYDLKFIWLLCDESCVCVHIHDQFDLWYAYPYRSLPTAVLFVWSITWYSSSYDTHMHIKGCNFLNGHCRTADAYVIPYRKLPKKHLRFHLFFYVLLKVVTYLN